MKKVVLSFDDSRADFYSRAYPVLSRYNISSTLNVISSFVEGKGKIGFPSAKGAVTKEQLQFLHKTGLVEIACHGSEHQNTAEDVLANIDKLKQLGIDVHRIGFASPNSVLTWENKNNDGIWDLVQSGNLLYVRSGVQIRREGIVYILKSIINQFIHSPKLFYNLNKRNLVFDEENRFLLSVAVFSYTTLSEIKYLISRMPDDSSVILMFHSILSQADPGYKKDKYYWPVNRFEELCSYLKSCDHVQVCKTNEIIR